MNKNRKEYIVEDLLKDSETLMHTLDNPDVFEEEVDEDVKNGFVERAIRDDEMEFFKAKFNLMTEGRVEARVSDDGMTCSIDLYPPRNEGRWPELHDVEVVLENEDVDGFEAKTVHQALENLRIVNEPIFDQIVAKGMSAVSRIPEHILLDSSLFQKEELEEKGGRVDYRQVKPFTVVKKDQELGKVIPERHGAHGRSVRGEEIPFPTEKVEEIRTGKNIAIQGDVIYATTHGTLQLKDGLLEVRELLVITGDVGYKTGHVDFPGDVLLNGSVAEGFHINAGENLFVEQTLDATDVITGGDFNAKKGVIGRGEAKIKVGGSFKARFVEMCYIEAAGDVQIDVGAMNSVVYSGGTIRSGPKGIMVGGKLVARDGVVFNQIGNAAETPTTLIAGVDYRILRKIEWIRDKNVEITHRISQLRLSKANLPGKESNIQQMESTLRSALLKLNETAQDLIPRLHASETATIRVMGTVYPGTYIEICHISHVVERPTKGVVFALNKDKGEITLRNA